VTRARRKVSRAQSLGLGLALAAACALVLAVTRYPARRVELAAPAASAAPPPAAEPDGAACAEHQLAKPTGHTTGLGCDEVRQVIRQIHLKFPASPRPPDPALFAEGVANWLDPYGFWSAAPEAPSRAQVFADAELLLDELRAPSTASCDASRAIARSLVAFMTDLRAVYDEAIATAPRLSREAAGGLSMEPVFDEPQVTTPPEKLARELGRRLGAIDAAYRGSVATYVASGRDRYFPPLDTVGWQRLVLAAALRAYIEAIDPHGQWAPLDEEWSLYSGDPSFYDPDRLWGDMVRTALGVRVVDDPTAPLELDDLVLEVDGVATTGLSFEQVEQLSRASGTVGPNGMARRLVVLRQGEAYPSVLEVVAPAPEELATEDDGIDADELEVELVPYGHSYAAVVTVPFVRDDLGERLLEALDSLASDGPPQGLVLDLRGNAGGSMDGATSALSVFLPGVPVFPLLHSGRLVEVLSTAGGAADRFQGPLAVLVDGETASAAEMIAGALDRYRRAVVLGQATYGKGCVQEYFEDDAGAGILRLTTRLFALPDGSPVQHRGLVPAILLGRPTATEHEADVKGTLDGVRGPDVRVAVPDAPAWPSPSGRLGPCREPLVCSALGRVARVPARAFRGDFSGSDPAGRRRREPARHP
jgi:carboxyl-terminal processing protease